MDSQGNRHACHRECYVSGTRAQEWPEPRLQKCAAMTNRANPSNPLCGYCPGRCSWEHHLHIWFETKEVEDVEHNEQMARALQNCTSEAEQIEVRLATYRRIVNEYEEASECITEGAAELAVTYKRNALIGWDITLFQSITVYTTKLLGFAIFWEIFENSQLKTLLNSKILHIIMVFSKY